MKRKILIVGGVAGGATAAARLRRLDEDADIILFERGEYISFANCGLPYYIGDTITDRSKLTLQTPESFRARFRVDVRAGHEVAQINREAKSVTVRRVKDGTLYEETYDALVLSPGAEPVLPPIEGVRENGVFVLRSIPDTDRIRAFAHKPGVRRAVVVGGGYIGIEMAENLHALGMSVSIVELMDHVVQPLDSDMAGELHAHLVDKGVGLFLKCGVTGIHRTDEGLEVSTSVGGPLMADLVVMAVGVRPEGSLAKEAGLTMGARGAIATDEHMLTSDPSIYAVGDAVEVTDSVLGRKTFVPLASPANRQGRIAADNLCGIPSVYRGTQGTAILKAFDMTIAVTGANERTLKEAGIDYGRSYTFSASHATYYPGAAFMTVKLLYRKADGALLGAQLTGFEGVGNSPGKGILHVANAPALVVFSIPLATHRILLEEKGVGGFHLQRTPHQLVPRAIKFNRVPEGGLLDLAPAFSEYPRSNSNRLNTQIPDIFHDVPVLLAGLAFFLKRIGRVA